MVSRRDPEANRRKAVELGLTFPLVLQKSGEISLRYGIFATPVGYLIDEQGIIAADVAKGVEPILALATGAAAPNHHAAEAVPAATAGVREAGAGVASVRKGRCHKPFR
jgi:hypothetical protein